MARRISLREFQESLVRRLAEAQTSDRQALLGIQTGNENWLIDLIDTGEILPVPPLLTVPLTQSWFRGIANVRGNLYDVIDFSNFQQGRMTPQTGQARLLLLNARHRVNSALLVNRTSGLHSLDEFELDPQQGDERVWVAEKLRDMQERLWLRLNVPALLESPVFLEAAYERA